MSAATSGFTETTRPDIAALIRATWPVLIALQPDPEAPVLPALVVDLENADAAGTRGIFSGVCRATLARMPAPIIVITSDEPPADRNGNVMPETGSRPTTAPRLMTACPTIHA